jgi:HSP20 family protein
MTKSILTFSPAAWIDQFFNDVEGSAPATRVGFTPAIDVIEERDAYLLRAELPGVSKDEILIEVKDNRLTLSGKKTTVLSGEQGRYRYFESRQGAFSRSFELPRNVRSEAIEAKHDQGVLTLTLPKVEEAKPKAIPIQ